MGTADKDYFLDGHGKVTTDESKASVLLIRKDQEIPKEIADQYGIGKASKADSGDSEKAAKPAENKAKKPAANK